MRLLPESDDALVLRTDFSDDDTWEAIRDEVSAPVGVLGFQANVRFIDDPEYDGAPNGEIAGLVRAGSNHGFVIVADRVTMTHLSLANMDFEEFAGAVDDDGVFRGFE